MSLETSVTSSAENETLQSRESEIAKVEDGIKGDLGDLRGNVETMTRRVFLEKTAKVIGAAALSQVPFLGKEAQAQSGQKTQEILLADSGQVVTDAGGSRARETREVLRANEVDLSPYILDDEEYRECFKDKGLKVKLSLPPNFGYTKAQIEKGLTIVFSHYQTPFLKIRNYGREGIGLYFFDKVGKFTPDLRVEQETGKIPSVQKFCERDLMSSVYNVMYGDYSKEEIARMTKPSVGSNAIKETVKQRQTVSLEEMVEKARDLGKLKSSESKAVVDKTVSFVREEARRAISGSNRFDDKVFTQVKQIEYHLRQNGYKAEASDLSSRLSKISEAVRMAERTRDLNCLEIKFSNQVTDEEIEDIAAEMEAFMKTLLANSVDKAKVMASSEYKECSSDITQIKTYSTRNYLLKASEIQHKAVAIQINNHHRALYNLINKSNKTLALNNIH